MKQATIRESLSVFILSGSLFLPVAQAQTKWEGETGIGLVRATGNERQSSLNAAVDLSYQTRPWTHNVLGDYYRSAEQGESTLERAALGYKVDRQLSAQWYGWAAVRYERDEFADLNRRWASLLGIGFKALDSERHKLGIEFGAGRRHSQFVSPRIESKETVASVSVNYRGKLTETVSLSERLLLESGKDNTLISATTGLTVQMSERLALNLSHVLRRNSDIPGSNGGKTNSLTTVNLLVTF